MGYQVAFICEGPTDTPILEAVVEAIIGSDFEPLYLQPERDMLRDDGEEWGPGNDDRVRAWCEQRRGDLEYAVFADIIVLQLDADRCAKFSVANTADLCRIIKGWLGSSAKDERLVIAIPAQASEAWLLTSQSSVTPNLEQLRHPEAKLADLGLLARDADGDAIKKREKYVNLASKLRDELARVRRVLPELERFASKLEAQRDRLTV